MTGFEGTFSVGVITEMDLQYNPGPTAWKMSEIIDFYHGERATITKGYRIAEKPDHWRT